MNLRIGSRASKLAVTQAEAVAFALRARNPGLHVTMTTIATTGDREADQALLNIGGKGVFVKEIEEALLKKEIDLAIHSMKDMPQSLPAGLMLGPTPEREDVRDVLISRFGEFLHELPRGSIVGTSSPRRRAQILGKYKKRQYKLDPIRGNIDTRLKKLQEGRYDAIVLAMAGLKRLGLESEITQVLETDDIMPAPCQGCLGLELRSDDMQTLKLLETIKHETSDQMARAERAFLQALGGDCLIPVAAVTKIDGPRIRMDALLIDPENGNGIRVQEEGTGEAPELIGAKLAGRLLYEGGAELMAKLDASKPA